MIERKMLDALENDKTRYSEVHMHPATLKAFSYEVFSAKPRISTTTEPLPIALAGNEVGYVVGGAILKIQPKWEGVARDELWLVADGVKHRVQL